MLHGQSRPQSSRLRGAKRLSGGTKFEINRKSRCLQKSKLADWGGKHAQASHLDAGPVHGVTRVLTVSTGDERTP